MGYDKEREIEAPFNMAIATLMRLDNILKQLTYLDTMYPRDSIEKQKIHLGLIKQLYINSASLLNETEIKNYKEVLELSLKQKTGIKAGSQKHNYIYDPKLELRLNEIAIELQQKLKRFFMPPTKDPRRAVVGFK